jgi:hypothetical protein
MSRPQPMGKKQEPPPETPLYVLCPQCGGAKSYVDESGDYHACLCKDGYVRTGYTEQRFDALVKENDRLLILLHRIALAGPAGWVHAADETKDRFPEIEGAKSRAKG